MKSTRPKSTFLAKLKLHAFARIDIASIVFFRIVLGLFIVGHIWRYYAADRVFWYWLQPHFLFKYWGFSWIQPWPGNGLYIHWVLLGVLGFCIAIGFLYRLSASLFCIGYTYTFLLEEARWVNHTYLICLLSFLLIFVPAHRAFSVDALLRPKLRSQTVPAWCLWLLCTQIGVVYFFAGVAKLFSPDWLQGEPMGSWLVLADVPAAVAGFFRQQWVVYLFTYASVLFDLLVVPCLLWKRTRLAAFGVTIIFHCINSRLFPIEIFPWLMLAATTLFFPPSWPRRMLSFFWRKHGLVPIAAEPSAIPSSQRRQRITLVLIGLYIAIQVLAPLRFLLDRGGAEWWSSEHRFSWRMLLEIHQVHIYFYVTDTNLGQTVQVRPEQFLSPEQNIGLGWKPDLLLQCARYLAEVTPRAGPKPLRVEARVLLSLNGRKPQLIVDPNVDLAAEPRTFGRPRWLREIHEPLPNPRPDSMEDVFAPKLPGL